MNEFGVATPISKDIEKTSVSEPNATTRKLFVDLVCGRNDQAERIKSFGMSTGTERRQVAILRPNVFPGAERRTTRSKVVTTKTVKFGDEAYRLPDEIASEVHNSQHCGPPK
jgi:hypothetical protein